MKRNRISAGILLAVGILVLLYTGSYGMFCVLAAVLFLLLCLAIYTVLAGRNLAGYIQLPENGEKKARISGKICIENHSILPLFCVGCDLYWANRLTGEKGKEKILFGIAGKKTLEAMGIFNSSGNSNSSNSTSSSDLNLLARTVYSEARGEPYAGQVAVAAVVLNRVKSSSFPNTIAGVIYQKGAFTAVSDGQINLTPNQTAYNAARDALNGWDPSYGSIYYFNPSTATNAWIWSRPHVVTIGKHRFCK